MHSWSRTALLVAIGVTPLLSADYALAQLGSPGIQGQPLRRRYQDANQRAAGNLEEFVKNLRDPDPGVRLEAVRSLASSQDKKAVEYLIEATADSDPRVKLKAIDSLGALRATDATPALIQVLYLRSSEPWLKQRVLVALGKIGDNRAVRPIADYLSRDADGDADSTTLGTAIFSLGEIGDQGAVADLERVAQRDGDQRIQQLARDAIGKITQKQINPEVQVKALRDALGDEQRPASASAAPPIAY